MTIRITAPHFNVSALSIVFAGITLVLPVHAQDRLKTMPGHAQYRRMLREILSVSAGMRPVIQWVDGGRALEFRRGDRTFRYDIADRREVAINDFTRPPAPRGRRVGTGGPERGRQYESALSPDGQFRAFYRDRNLWISDAQGLHAFPVTTEGDARTRVKFGSASWVYGEELNQNTAMWWSPDSKKIAFYRFDESAVPDYFLQLDQTKIQSRVDIEPYPKAGAPNPVVDLLIYDTGTRRTIPVDVRDGKPFSNEVVGHYVYRVMWSPDGAELLFHRTNRRQNVLELAACNPETGRCRVLVREEWPSSWTENAPEMRWLEDGQRFIWASERTGFKNYYLYHRNGQLIAPLTQHAFEVAGIVSVDKKNDRLYYLARSGDNPMKLQLHAVRLDGRDDRRLTDPAFHHTISMAPDHRHFVDTAQTHVTPPVSRLMDVAGNVVAELVASDLTRFTQLGLQKAEQFRFRAADGQTLLYGMLYFPSSFDPGRSYPLLVDVYNGPETNGARETFSLPPALTEYGFLVATLDARSAAGYGKRRMDAIYGDLSVIVDDVAAGVRALCERPYVARGRVGIFGTSFGGYVAALALLRYPDVFRAACASSAVTAWEHYDTIYTERYMGLPQENAVGYARSSAVRLADRLQGRLMIYYGTADNNVHPSNALQLIQALQRAGKSFEVQVGPDQGHSSINPDRMMEFFIEHLLLSPPQPSPAALERTEPQGMPSCVANGSALRVQIAHERATST